MLIFALAFVAAAVVCTLLAVNILDEIGRK